MYYTQTDFTLETGIFAFDRLSVPTHCVCKYRSSRMRANYIIAKKPPLVSVWADHRYFFHRRQVFIQSAGHAIAWDEVKPSPFLTLSPAFVRSADGNFSQPFFHQQRYRNWVSFMTARNLNNNRSCHFQDNFALCKPGVVPACVFLRTARGGSSNCISDNVT